MSHIRLGDNRRKKSMGKAGVIIAGLALLLLWSIGIGLVSLYFASAAIVHGDVLFGTYFDSFQLIWLNILPCILLTALFFLLTNRVWGGVLGSGLIVLLGSLVNFYKITLRNDPLIAADMTLFSEAAKMTGNYELSFPKSVILTVIVFFLAVGLSAWLFKLRIKDLRVRLGLLLLLGAVIGLALTGVYFDEELYNKTENIEANKWYLSRWSDRDQFVCRGFLYPFFHSAKTAVEKAPDGYDAKAAAEYLASFEDSDIPEDKRVNIIAIMLEAYNDLSEYGVLDIGVDPYEYFHKLEKESLSGRLVTNIFAGGTIDTERSFVTGYTYMSQYRKAVPTYVSYLASQGYTVEGGHPGYDWFYNRRNVCEYFGFENYYFFEDRHETKSEGLMMDKDFFPDILRLYEQNKESGKPYFNFSVTYQNHGPYADGFLYDGQHIFAKNKGYSDEGYRILNNYLWGIKETDRAIETLIETLRKKDDPFVVVLFGDHQPWLGDGSYVYDEIGLDIDRSTEEGFYNYYSTPYVIWANKAAKEVTGGTFKGDGGSFSPCFLMNRLFEECGYGGSAFMKAANRLMEQVDVVSRAGVYRVAGQGLTRQPEGEAQEALRTFRRLEYYMKKDY